MLRNGLALRRMEVIVVALAGSRTQVNLLSQMLRACAKLVRERRWRGLTMILAHI